MTYRKIVEIFSSTWLYFKHDSQLFKKIMYGNCLYLLMWIDLFYLLMFVALIVFIVSHGFGLFAWSSKSMWSVHTPSLWILIMYRQTRLLRDREEQMDRNLMKNIIRAWKELRSVREQQHCTNTPLKLQIIKSVAPRNCWLLTSDFPPPPLVNILSSVAKTRVS